MSYQKLYQEAQPKYKLVLDLLVQHGLTLEQIVNLNVSDITSEGLKVGEKIVTLSPEVFPVFVKYIASNKDRLTEALFPGLKGGRVTEKNLVLGLRGIAKRNGIKLGEIKELPQLSIGRVPKFDPRELQTMDDIRKFLGLAQ